MNDQIKTIREKCIDVNPEIENDDIKLSELWDAISEAGHKEVFQNLSKNHWLFAHNKVFSRPIRLADVLLAIQHKNFKEKPDFWYKNVFPLVTPHYECAWINIKDDLTLQSQETIQFIYELLK